MSGPIEKVVTYITKADRLLVFVHPDIPEAGVQVPAGSVEPGEDPSEAALREAREETGLDDFALVRPLGVQELDDPAEAGKLFTRRHYFHLSFQGEAPERWRSRELDPSDGTPGPIEFEFYWTPFSHDSPSLMGGMDAMLPELGADA